MQGGLAVRQSSRRSEEVHHVCSHIERPAFSPVKHEHGDTLVSPTSGGWCLQTSGPVMSAGSPDMLLFNQERAVGIIGPRYISRPGLGSAYTSFVCSVFSICRRKHIAYAYDCRSMYGPLIHMRIVGLPALSTFSRKPTHRPFYSHNSF